MYHDFVSLKTASGDATLVRPTEWNQAHRLGDWLWPVIEAVPALDQADWAPSSGGRTWNDAAGRNRAVIIRAQPASMSFIGGLAGGADGRMAVVKNDSVDGMIALLDEDTGSVAANRLRVCCESLWLLPGQFATLAYDGVDQRWMLRAVSLDPRWLDIRTAVILPSTGTGVLSAGIPTSNTATLSTLAPSGTPTNEFLAAAATQITNSTASGSSDVRGTALNFMRGATARRQGFWFNAAFRITAASATGGAMVAMSNSAAAVTSLPSATNNLIYCGIGTAGETTLRVGARAGAAHTAVDLGANFPVPNATAAYEVSFLAVPNQSRVVYGVRRLDSRALAGGALTANLPSTTTGLAPRANVMVGGTAAATTLQFNRLLARRLDA